MVASRKFPTGMRPSPRHKLLAVPPYHVLKAPPTQFAWIPSKLDMWGNDRYGDCVSAEEAFAKATYTPEIFIDANTVEGWAQKHGFLNGADLQEVMDAMIKSGFAVGSQLYNDGPYQGVDYSNDTVLQSAIAQGPVKIAIQSSQLPSGAGNNQGWWITGPGNRGPDDHCVALCGFGPAGWLFQQLNVPLPSGLNASTPGYLLYTWSTIGFVDHAWIMAATSEAYVRNPTTVGVPPLTPPPPPPPPPPVQEALTLSQALAAGTYRIGPMALTVPTGVPAGAYVLVRNDPPNPVLEDEKAARSALEKLITDVPATAQNDIQAARTALEKLIADFPANK